MPDPKWDRKVENLYLLALVKDDTLYSLRDLRDNHITMLASIRDISVQYILEHFKHFGITDGHIRIFIHYYPSAWRLHIHFQHISSTIALGGNTQVGKAHLLSTVITNLVMNGNYYRDSTIECVKVQ
jgi:m7GpppX diphosphatase